MPIDIRKTTPPSPFFFKAWYKAETGHFMHNVAYRFDSKEYKCPTTIITDLLWAEYQLRFATQWKQLWNERRQDCLDKDNNSDSGSPSAMDDYDWSEFDLVHQEYEWCVREMYLKESALPYETLRSLYDSLRDNPDWYLRKSLVAECAASGGCCGRSCGCCAKRLRDMPRKGMNGHCSFACGCCIIERELHIPSETVDDMHQQYKKALESDNPFFFLRIASANFAPLEERLDVCENREVSAETEVESLGTIKEEPSDGSALDELPSKPEDYLEISPPSYESHLNGTNATEDTSTDSGRSNSFTRLRHTFSFNRR